MTWAGKWIGQHGRVLLAALVALTLVALEGMPAAHLDARAQVGGAGTAEIRIAKQILDANGNVMPNADRSGFVFNVTGPDGFTVTQSTNAIGVIVISNLATPAGALYTVTEQPRGGFTFVAAAVDGVGVTNGQPFLVGPRQIRQVLVQNLQGTATGTVVIQKSIVDASGNPASGNPSRAGFTFNLTCGGSFSQQAITDGNGVASIVNVPAGNCVINETPASGFTLASIIPAGAASDIGNNGTIAVVAGQTLNIAVRNMQASSTARFSGNVTIDGQSAPPGTAVTAVVDGRECGRANVDGSARYAVDVASDAQQPGCGRSGVDVRFLMAPPELAGPPWQASASRSFQPGSSTELSVAVDLSRIAADDGNVPLTGWYWEDPRSISVSSTPCDAQSSDRTRRLASRAIQMWRDAGSRGMLARVSEGSDACNPERPGIVVVEQERTEIDAAVLVLAYGAGNPGPECNASDTCALFSGFVVVNTAASRTQTDDHLARQIARAIGQLMGLGEAWRCTGGSIMSSAATCPYPSQSVGVDDIAAVNRRIAGERP